MSSLCRALVVLALLGVAAWPAMAADRSDEPRRFSGIDQLDGTWDVVGGDQTLPGRFDLPTGIAIGAEAGNARVHPFTPAGR